MKHPEVQGLKDPELTVVVVKVRQNLELVTRLLNRHCGYSWSDSAKKLVDESIFAIDLLAEERANGKP